MRVSAKLKLQSTDSNESFNTSGGRTPSSTHNNSNRHSQWLVRSDGNLIALIYGFLTLVVRCGELPRLKDEQVRENPTVKLFLESQAPGFYSVLLHPATTLRIRVIEFLREQFNIVSLYHTLLSKDFMLCKAAHFRYSFLHALSYDAHFLTDLMVSLITVAVKVQQFENLYMVLHQIDFEIGRSQEKQHQLEVILDCVIRRDYDELAAAGVKLEDLCAFASQAANALSSVRGQCQGDAERGVIERVIMLLEQGAVETWKEGFATLVKVK